MTQPDETDQHLSRAELYRAACTPRHLPDNFVASMRYWLIKDATWVPVPDTDDADRVRTDPFTTALRAVIGEAEFWLGQVEVSRKLGQEEPHDRAAAYRQGSNHESTYCANTLLRRIAQELYREHVPQEERVQ